MRRALLACLLLAACGRAPEPPRDLDALDRELTAANQQDPAVAQALNGPIMIDPTLSASSNANAVRPAPRPDDGGTPADPPLRDPVNPATLRRAPAPVAGCPQCGARSASWTLGALAASQPAARGCAPVSYSAGWANRLPADLPLYPQARVVEAAGTAAGTCALRIVTLATAAAPAKVVDWYYTRATAARYSAEHRKDAAMHVLGGTRGGDAYVVYVAARAGGGSTVDLLTNAGS